MIVLPLTAFLLLAAGPAYAAPTTETNTAKGLVETFVDVVPSCEGGGPLYTITTTPNLIEHETISDDGRVHATFTQTGAFTAVPLDDPSLPSYTGKFTVWGGSTPTGPPWTAPSRSTREGRAQTVPASRTPTWTTSTCAQTGPSRSSSTATDSDSGPTVEPASS